MQTAKQKDNDADDSEFKAQRQDAIAEAAKGGTKKVFGGGSKQLVDGNVQKIIDKGYTEEQAVTALKYSRNNVDKALGNLKRREENQKRGNDYEPREKRGGKGSKDNADPTASKPSTNVSLFSFLEDKIPATESTAKDTHHEQRFENNISSSFRKHDKENTNKSQHWSSNEHKSSHNRNSNYNNNRDTRDSRDSRDSREYRGGSAGHKDSKFHSNSNYSSYQSKSSNYQQNQSNHYQQKPSSAANNSTTSSSSYNNSNSNSNNHISNKKYEKYEKYDKYEKFDKYQQKPEYNKQSSYQQQAPVSQQQNNYNKPRTSNNSGKYYNDGNSSRNVVESMEKMTLRGNSSHANSTPPTMSNPPPNYQPTAPSNETSKQKPFVKPGNYPIVGFQNKEANEHAKNALKTQTIPGVVQQPPINIIHQQQQQHPNQNTNWQKGAHKPQPMQPHPNQVTMTMKNQPPAPFSNPPPGVVQQSLPQPFVQQPTMIPHPMPAVFPTPMNYPTQIIMQGAPPGIPPSTQQVNTQPQHGGGLKIGDACMAKYWEDGQVREISM